MFPGNDIVSSLIAVQMGGTGGKAKAKTITKNGAYAITDEEKSEGYVGYSPLNVNVPTGANIIPLTITVPGTYNAADYGCDGFNPVVSDSSGGGSGGSFCYEDDDVFVFVYDKWEVDLKWRPSMENDPTEIRFCIPAYVIYKHAAEVKVTWFSGSHAIIGNGEYFGPSPGSYLILSISEWKISNINVRRIANESDGTQFKIEVSITCEASGIAEYLGSFTYKSTHTVTNSNWLFDENA